MPENETIASPSSEISEPKEARNHIAGCAIFIVILLTVIFVISIATYTYFDYKKAVVSITEENKTDTPIANNLDTTSTAALDKKFGDFCGLVKDKQPATLELSIDDINLAIAHFPKLKEFKTSLFVTELIPSPDNKKDLIVTRASFKMRPGFNPDRHMNGVVKFRPEITEGSIFPIIEEALPDTANPVPEKVKQALSTLMFTEYRNDEEIKDVFHKLTTVKVIDGKLVITSDPNNQAVAIIDQTVTEEHKNQAVQLIALLCFIFVTTILFAIWYRKFRRKQKAGQ